MIIVLVAVVALLVAFVALRPNTGSPSPATTSAATSTVQATSPAATAAPAEPATTTIVIRNGEPVGGLAKLSYKQGETVRLVVTSADTSSDVHVHGYDIDGALAPGKPARFDFVAKHSGRFEVELHPNTQIAQLDVVP